MNDDYSDTGTVALAELDLGFELTDLSDPERRDLVYELGPEGRSVIFSKRDEEMKEKGSRQKLRWQYYREK